MTVEISSGVFSENTIVIIMGIVLFVLLVLAVILCFCIRKRKHQNNKLFIEKYGKNDHHGTTRDFSDTASNASSIRSSDERSYHESVEMVGVYGVEFDDQTVIPGAYGVEFDQTTMRLPSSSLPMMDAEDELMASRTEGEEETFVPDDETGFNPNRSSVIVNLPRNSQSQPNSS